MSPFSLEAERAFSSCGGGVSGSVGIVQAQRAVFEQPFRFRSGAEIPRFELMYETYG